MLGVILQLKDVGLTRYTPKQPKGAKKPWAPPRLGGHKCAVQVRRDHAEVLAVGGFGAQSLDKLDGV